MRVWFVWSGSGSGVSGSLRWFASALILTVALSPAAQAQEPLDLFTDVPGLGDCCIRIAAWNLRHINVEGQAGTFLPGITEDEDFAILIATFAKAILDLGLDVVAISEHQPRTGEPNRLHQVRDALNSGSTGNPWLADESQIPYTGNQGSFGGLQLAVLWNSNRVTIDPTQDELLLGLRQGDRLRAPWRVPVTAGALSFDMIIVHLKSGGEFPQQDEVNALENHIRANYSGPGQNLILLGDWNIRPDTSQGRGRLRQLMVPVTGGDLMEILTIEEQPIDLTGWASLRNRGLLGFDDPVSRLIPFTHFNLNTIDTFLDHLAISRGLSEIFDHPIELTLADGSTDLRPGIRVAVPAMREVDYHKLTDHLPVVLTLRITDAGGGAAPAGPLQIVAAVPNPFGVDRESEEVHLMNVSGAPVPLNNWRIGDSTGTRFWNLTNADGVVQPGATIRVVRNNRNMSLNNDGDIITLFAPGNSVPVDQQQYGDAASGEVFHFTH